MFKKKKVDNVWQSRFFVLDSETLKYYKKITVSTKISIFKFHCSVLIVVRYDHQKFAYYSNSNCIIFSSA